MQQSSSKAQPAPSPRDPRSAASASKAKAAPELRKPASGSPRSGSFATPTRDGFTRDVAPHLTRPPSAPARRDPYVTTKARSASTPRAPTQKRPPIPPSPLAKAPSKQMSASSPKLECSGPPLASTLVSLDKVGNDSSETVMPPKNAPTSTVTAQSVSPATPSQSTVFSPVPDSTTAPHVTAVLVAPTPGEEIRSQIFRQYTESLVAQDLGALPPELDGTQRNQELFETPYTIVLRARALEPLRAYFVRVGSQWKFIVGIIGQFELAIEQLRELIGRAHALLAIPASQRFLAEDWDEELEFVTNGEYKRYGIALRAFRHVTHWLDYATVYLHYLIGRVDCSEIPSLPPPLDLELNGSYNSFAEATSIAARNGQAAVSSGAPSPASTRPSSPVGTWLPKDSVAMTKSWGKSDVNTFHGAPFKAEAVQRKNRRLTTSDMFTVIGNISLMLSQ
ncbi:hypothetical protein AURDEDRAFT_168435 [Auricularia subglabra TFB-10046 SS5]|nr:hypothetical protein AURDEDRAFT_168435 [Auricularia subglabra TFB-10046 SS5]